MKNSRKEESYEDIFQFVKKKIARYPNSERLAGQLAMIMDAWRILRKLPASEQTEEYDRTIREWYQAALKSEDEEVRERAADSLYTYYYRNERYEEAEKYPSYFSEERSSPENTSGNALPEAGKNSTTLTEHMKNCSSRGTTSWKSPCRISSSGPLRTAIWKKPAS